MNNRFIILIPSYNNEKWVSQNLESVLTQTYTNFRVVYYNDASSDSTYELAKGYADKDSRINLINAKERRMKTWFCDHLLDFEDVLDNDIVCMLDGDDFLANEEILNYLNEVYNKINCWMTYGGMVVWEGGEKLVEPFPQNSEAPLEVKQRKLYRKDMWRYSHFRTYRGFLWKRINRSDWVSKHNGQYNTIEDLVSAYACMEMSPADKIFRIPQTVYILNYSTTNGGSRACTENKVNNVGPIYEAEVRGRAPYPELSIISPTLAGGLGNQMFEVAVAASLAKDNNALAVINPNEHILPNQGRNVKNYLTNIFSKIVTDTTPPLKTMYSWEHMSYKPVPYQPNMKLGGHYQSYKYFDHNRSYIQDLFTPKGFVPKQNNVTAIQVRRGDYYKFPGYHFLLTPDYYSKAVKMAEPSEIHIFSDDIPWCQANLKFDAPVTYRKADSDWEELLEMSQCQNIIISNSSFGWWAAYLNTRKDKRVFVPSVWFGPKLMEDGFQMDDLVLPDWTRIEL